MERGGEVSNNHVVGYRGREITLPALRFLLFSFQVKNGLHVLWCHAPPLYFSLYNLFVACSSVRSYFPGMYFSISFLIDTMYAEAYSGNTHLCALLAVTAGGGDTPKREPRKETPLLGPV